MGEGAPTVGRSTVMIKTQYSWGPTEAEHSVGLITSIGPRHAFVYTTIIPPPGEMIRLKMPQVGKGGAVELRGVVSLPEDNKVAGFNVEFSHFIRGEANLFEFLGVSRSDFSPLAGPETWSPPGEPAAEAEVLEGEIAVRVGQNRPSDPGTVVDVSETGLYLRTGPGSEEPWQLKQNVRLELSVPMGSANRS